MPVWKPPVSLLSAGGIKVPRYHHLKAILTANQDITYKEQLESESSSDDCSMGYLRGSDYYRKGGGPDAE